MKRLWILVLMLFVTTSPAAWAQQAKPHVKSSTTIVQPLVLYDDFNESRIDPSKWVGTGGDNSDLREAVRELAPAWQGQGNNRRLHVFLDAYAETANDQDGHGGRFGLRFARPELVKEISFTLAVNRTRVVGCQNNPTMAIGVSEFYGTFFNTENSPTSLLGDVVVVINMNRQPWMPEGSLQVYAFYQRCDDEACGARTMLDTGELGWVSLGEPATLRVKWDQPNHQFIFQLNRQPAFISKYEVSDLSPAYDASKYIDILWGIPNCTTAPRPETMMDAYFDNIYVNPQ